MTLKLFTAMLPAASLAEQLTVVVPGGKIVPEDGAHVTVGLAGPAVSAAAAVKVTTAPAGMLWGTLILAGRVSEGGVVSVMVMVNESLTVLPAVSAAEQLTNVEPTRKSESEDGVQVAGIEPSKISLALAE